jgi:hypothetical protein
MASELLSFRLSGNELEWLKSQQLEDETLNLTAKRLLLGLMNGTVDTPVDTSVYTPVDTQQVEAIIEEKIQAKFEEMYHQIVNNVNYILDKRLGVADDDSVQNQIQVDDKNVDTVDTPVNTPVDIPVDTPVDTLVDTPVDTLESKTLEQLRTIAKQMGVPYKVRTKKAELISLISARKSEENPDHHEP